MVKNKEQVRHFYYRTWHKISKHIDFANGEFPFFTLTTANNWPDIFTTNPIKTETELIECWFKLFSVKCNWTNSYSLRTNIWLLVIWTSNRTRKVCFNCAVVKKKVAILRLWSPSILICLNISVYVIISRLLCPSRCFLSRCVCLTNFVAISRSSGSPPSRAPLVSSLLWRVISAWHACVLGVAMLWPALFLLPSPVYSRVPKKSSQELYGLICYAELRKKVGGCKRTANIHNSSPMLVFWCI